MMRKTLFFICFLLTFNAFSQDEDKQKSLDIPISIFSNYSFDKLQYNNIDASSLNLIGYKFMIVDYMNTAFLYNNLHFDLRNINRDISFDDINDNYRKAELNTFDVSRNSNHFIWTMWDTSLQKQYQQNNN